MQKMITKLMAGMLLCPMVAEVGAVWSMPNIGLNWPMVTYRNGQGTFNREAGILAGVCVLCGLWKWWNLSKRNSRLRQIIKEERDSIKEERDSIVEIVNNTQSLALTFASLADHAIAVVKGDSEEERRKLLSTQPAEGYAKPLREKFELTNKKLHEELDKAGMLNKMKTPSQNNPERS
jgi:hypothetical protein